jgi:hypothetical protein
MKRSRRLAGICIAIVSLCSALASRSGAQQTPPPYPAQQCGTSGSDATIIGRLPSKASAAYYAQDSVSGYVVPANGIAPPGSGAAQYLSLIESIANPYPSVGSSPTSPPSISTTALTQSLQYANFQPAVAGLPITGTSAFQFTCHSLPHYTNYQFIATIYQPFATCGTMGDTKTVQITYYYIATGQTLGKNSTVYINPKKWSLIGTHPTVFGIPTPPCYPPGSTPGP